jgi:serine/threonine-protein kinase
MAADRFGIVGTVIASAYHVESVVAEGGFGVVYRARHGGFRAPVALKCLKVPQHLAREYQRRFIEHFRAEGEVMFRLSASIPNVVRPLHVDTMTTPAGAFVPFLVLEWLEGETLDAVLRARVAAGKRPLGVPDALELLEPVGRALERAHHFTGPAGAESISHCDLKPENVFIATAGGERLVKILDFGVAKVRGAATRAAQGTPGSAPEPALFTPAYGAPEQWNPKQFGETGPWTDVWGLALTLVETLVGRPVLAGDQASVMRQALDPKRRPTPFASGVVVGDALEAVLTRALAVDPRERYPEAGAFVRALKDAAGGALEVAAAPAPEIPDLVPISRRPSGAQRIEQDPVRTPSAAKRAELPLERSVSGAHKLELPGVGNIDFEDDSSGDGSGIALDISADELVRKGSLAPEPAPPVSVPALEAPASARGLVLEPVPHVISELGAVPSAHTPAHQAAFPASTSPPLKAPSALSPQPAPLEPERPRAQPPSPSPPSLVERPLGLRLVPGLALAGSSILLTLLDRVYAAIHGEVFSLGPLRTSTLAALLLVVGLGLAGRELLRGKGR